jgi:hypothetical protein
MRQTLIYVKSSLVGLLSIALTALISFVILSIRLNANSKGQAIDLDAKSIARSHQQSAFWLP